MVGIVRLTVAFSGIFELEASPEEDQSMQEKHNKRRNQKERQKQLKNPKFRFVGTPEKKCRKTRC